MTPSINSQQLIGRRGELMAELFLQELKPLFVARTDSLDWGVDFFVGFQNSRGGVNVAAVEVKATEGPVGPSYPLRQRTFHLLSNSNIPGFLLVIDVKLNRHYYAELHSNEQSHGRTTVSVQLTEVTELTRTALVQRLQGLS